MSTEHDQDPSESDDSEAPIDTLTQASHCIASLRLGRSGTVIGSVEDTNAFIDSLYVPGPIDGLAREFFNEESPAGELLILLGSAGDGKTAIFGHAFRASEAGWLDPELINLDATESTSTTRTETEQLSQFLEEITEQLGEADEPRRGLAINLGLALDFFRTGENADRFEAIHTAIKEARNPQNFEEGCLYQSDEGITVANLSHRRLFDTHPSTLGDGFLNDLVARFDHTNASSPFASISEEIADAASTNPIAYNLHQLTNPEVRDSLVRLLAAKVIISNEYLNPRRVLNYISKVLLPPSIIEELEDGTESKFESLTDAGVSAERLYLWNSVYDVLSKPGDESSRLDPCTVFSLEFDEEILAIQSDNRELDLEEDRHGFELLSPESLTRTVIRMRHLTKNNEIDYKTEERSSPFTQFAAARSVLDHLWHQQVEDEELVDEAADFMDETYGAVVSAIKRWSQQSHEGDLVRIADGRDSIEYQFLAEWERESATLDRKESMNRTTEETQLGKLWLSFENEVSIPLSYELYRLLSLINQGYNPDAVNPEESEGVRLLHSQLSQFTDKHDELQVRDYGDELIFKLQKKQGFNPGIEFIGS